MLLILASISTLMRRPVASYAVFKYAFSSAHDDMKLIKLRGLGNLTLCHVFSRHRWLKTRESGHCQLRYHPWCAYTLTVHEIILICVLASIGIKKTAIDLVRQRI